MIHINEYINKVHEELDTYDYDLLIAGYDPAFIAKGMSQVMYTVYPLNWSYRLCALCILGITYEMIAENKKRTN